MVPVASDEYGEGPAVVLLHGFCENRRIWQNLIPFLPRKYHYLVPDIPGFGQSALPEVPFTLEMIARKLLRWIDSQAVNKFMIIGHSMGGYIALEVAMQAKERCTGLGLFHSTAAADTAAKKENRTKSAAFIKKNGTEAFFKTFIPSLYYRGGDWEEEVKRMLESTSQEAVVAYTLAMRDRTDHQDFLTTYAGKTLFIAGEKDSFISAEALREQAESAVNSQYVLLKNTGHLGMLETPEDAARAVTQFLNKDGAMG